jgi:glycosyltransferase involved in cell wall biosynthesis
MTAPINLLWVRKMNFDRALWRTFDTNLLVRLKQLGYNITIITTYLDSIPSLETDMHIDYLKIPAVPMIRSLVFYILLYRKLLAVLLQQKMDLIMLDKHTFFMAFPFDILGKLGLLKTKVAVDFRDDIGNTRPSRLINFVANTLNVLGPLYACAMTGGVSASTSFGIDRITRLAGRKPKHTCALSTAVDLGIFDPTQIIPITLEQVSKKDLLVVYHGALSSNRGLLEVLEAITLLECPANLKFVMIGNGSLKARIEAALSEKRLRNNVLRFDSVAHQDVPRYLAACDVGILPYPDDSMWKVSSPLKLLEYLAMGKAVLLRDFEVFRAITKDLPHVYFLKDNKPETIAAALDGLLSQKHGIPGFSPAHRKRIAESFTWDQQASALDNHLRAILKD